MEVFDPTDDDLKDFVEKSLSGRTFQSFAESLDIPVDPSLAVSSETEDDRETQAVRILHQWRQRDNQATMEKLRRAMRESTLEETSSNPRKIAASYQSVRDAELKQLFAVFHESEESRNFRVVVLHGAAGMGKTFLAKEFVEKYTAFYPDGVVWISAESSLSIHLSHHTAITLHNYHTFNHFVDDLRTVQAIASEKKGILFVFDNAQDLELVKSCMPLITSNAHVLVITRSQSFQGAWADVPKFQLQPLDEDRAIRIMKTYTAVDEEVQDEALKQLIGKDMAACLPLALVYAAQKLKMNHHVNPSSYVEMFSKHVTTVREQLSNVSGWLKFYHLSHLEEDLKLKFDVESVGDIRSLSDGQIQRLGLSFFDQRRLKAGVVQLKSDKPIKLPLWEMDIHNLSSQSSHAWKILSYCALLSLEPISEYILRECLMEHISPFSEQKFRETLTQLIDTGSILQECGVSSAGNTRYCVPSRIQQYVRRYHLTDLDVQYSLIILSHVIARHLPSSKDIPSALQCMDPLLVEMLSHTQAVAKTVNQANILDQTCETIVDFVRVVAVTINDPWLELSLCQQGVKRALDKRLQSAEVASRMLDLAVCFATRQQYDECQQTLHEAQVIINQLQEPSVFINIRVFLLQTTVFSIQMMFHTQFAGSRLSEMYLSGQGSTARLTDLVTQYALKSEDAQIKELMSIVVSKTSESTNPANAVAPHYMNRISMLGVKSSSKILHGIMQDTLKNMSAQQMAEMADIDANFHLMATTNRRVWKALLSRDVATNVNLQSLNYWQSCGQYLYNVSNAKKALLVFQKILTMLQCCLPSGHRSIGETLKWIGDCHLAMEDTPQAFDNYFQASRILSLANQSATELAKFYTNLAKSCSQFKPELAEEKLMHSLQLFEKMADPLLILAASYELADHFYSQKRFDRVIEICQSADTRLVEQLGQLNMEIPGQMICMTLNATKLSSLVIHSLKEMGEYQTALVSSEAVFNEENQATVMVEMFASGRSVMADIKVCVGDCLLAENLKMEALSSYREALLLYEKSTGKGDPKMIAGLLSLARFHQTTAMTRSNEDHAIITSMEALSQVDTERKLDKCHVEDLGNLVTYFVTVGDQDSAQMCLEASMAVSELIERTDRATDCIDEDIVLPWSDSEPIPHEMETRATASSNKVTRVSDDLPASMSYSIKPLSDVTMRDLVAWSCTASMFAQVQENDKSVNTEHET